MRWLKSGDQKPESGSSLDIPRLERELGVRIGERGKTALSLACVEMDRSNHRELGAEHLIVGVIEEGGPAAQLLVEHGMTLDEARAQIAEALIYSIIMVPIEADAGRDTGGEHALIQLSRDTGGKFYYATSLAQLEDLIAATRLKLGADAIHALDTASA